MFSIELDNNFSSEKINNIYEHEAADNCFLIFIGGEYVQVLDQVMEKVETISKKIGLHPLGLFIPEDNNSQFTNYADGADFPLVICKVSLYYTILYHIYFHFIQLVILEHHFLDIQLLPSFPGHQADSRCCILHAVSWPLQHSSCETDHVQQWNSQ